jgi:RHS repeat-associated protein
MTALVRLKYGYDRASNRLFRRDEVARAQTPLAKYDELYGYDGLHRLTAFNRGELNGANTALTGSPTLTQGWTLDQTGNWSGFNQSVASALTQSRAHNTVNEITGITETVGSAWQDPAYDANGNMTTLPQPKQLGDGYTATYDAWNRLVKLTNDADANKTVAEHQYDGLNRRTVKKTYDSAGVLQETRLPFYSDQWQAVEERVGSSVNPERQFVWGQRYVDDLVLRDRDTNGDGTLDERFYALQDALFNVVGMIDVSGAVQERFAYQPYGQSEPLNPDFTPYSGTDYRWETRFTGREFDLESGLQINRRRYLHLQLGRWLSRDSVVYRGGLNLYLYASDRPTVALDPSGNISIGPIPIPPPLSNQLKCAVAFDLIADYMIQTGAWAPSYAHCWTHCMICSTCLGPIPADDLSYLWGLFTESYQYAACMALIAVKGKEEACKCGVCQSARQPSDFEDDETGCELGKKTLPGPFSNCESACEQAKGGKTPDELPEGPGTPREYGPLCQ